MRDGPNYQGTEIRLMNHLNAFIWYAIEVADFMARYELIAFSKRKSDVTF